MGNVLQVWISPAGKYGGHAILFMGLAQVDNSRRDFDYAVGGARDARCRAKESSGATWNGSDEYQVIGPGVVTRSNLAAASAGMCSVWQTWHAVSGPPW